MRTLFPRPLPDELLYSTLARSTYRSGHWSPKRLLDVAFARRTVVATPDLPSNLGDLVAATHPEWGLSERQIAESHTLLPFYTHYSGHARHARALKLMTGSGGSLLMRLGVAAGSARPVRTFQLCLGCFKSDIATYGEAYWHRAHHLPGVVMCGQHGMSLHQSGIPFRSASRHDYRPVPLDVDPAGLVSIVPNATELQLELLCRVAKVACELLTSPQRSSTPWPDYRPALRDRGFASGRGAGERLRAEFTNVIGSHAVSVTFRPSESDNLAWLADVLRPPRRSMHPIKHALMTVFLERTSTLSSECAPQEAAKVKTWGVYRNANLRSEAAALGDLGLSTRAIAHALELDWQTAKRLQDPLPERAIREQRNREIDRTAWQQLADSSPGAMKKSVRAKDPALYARLYRLDRAWIVGWSADNPTVPVLKRRVDWLARDAGWEANVRREVDRLLRQTPPVRASRNRVLGALGLRAQLQHWSARLPRTEAALGELCETTQAFQVRRLAHVIQEPRATKLPDWRVLRAAGINSARCADGGSSLIAQARKASAARARPKPDGDRQ